MVTDYTISRQAVLDIIDSELNGWLTDDERLHLERVEIAIEDLPIMYTVKHGKWINDNGLYKCTACNDHCTVAGWADCIPEEQMYKAFKFCPHCGARMGDVEKIGHWVDHIKDFWCSECGCRILPEQVDSFSKCPNCGAKMDE